MENYNQPTENVTLNKERVEKINRIINILKQFSLDLKYTRKNIDVPINYKTVLNNNNLKEKQRELIVNLVNSINAEIINIPNTIDDSNKYSVFFKIIQDLDNWNRQTLYNIENINYSFGIIGLLNPLNITDNDLGDLEKK